MIITVDNIIIIIMLRLLKIMAKILKASTTFSSMHIQNYLYGCHNTLESIHACTLYTLESIAIHKVGLITVHPFWWGQV